MRPINRELLEKFLKKAGDELAGRWVVIGGTVLPLLGREFRATVDIDLICLEEGGGRQALKLMDLAERLGLPVESINQAGELFLKRIAGFEDHLEVLYQGKSATIYRPDLILFLKLKISRLSESDLEDCLRFIELQREAGAEIPTKGILRLLASEARKPMSPERRRRLNALKKAAMKAAR